MFIFFLCYFQLMHNVISYFRKSYFIPLGESCSVLGVGQQSRNGMTLLSKGLFYKNEYYAWGAQFKESQFIPLQHSVRTSPPLADYSRECCVKPVVQGWHIMMLVTLVMDPCYIPAIATYQALCVHFHT